MRSKNRLSNLSIVISFILIFSLIFPTAALADDTTPPLAESSEVLPPTEEPVPVESTPIIPDPTETPAAEEESAIEATENVNLTEIIQAATENNLSFSDPSGEPLVMGTVETANALALGDPYFTSGGVLYSFTFADCNPVTPGNQPCSTPIQAALDFSVTNTPDLLIAPDGTLRRTIYVDPGTYNEQLTINTQNLTLWGDAGALTLAGASPFAPVLDGSTFGAGSVGVTINVQGVTLIGFIIQNYGTAVYQPVVSGSNTINILNNTIVNNGDGVKVRNSVGSPGTEIHYNVFSNNSGFDIVNNDPDANNVQFINAQNNYWGCPTGPVVAYRIFTGHGNNKVWTGQWGYIDWATKYDYGINGVGFDPDPACAILYGSDSLFDFQINTNAYSPYKINIDSFLVSPETWAVTLDKSASPTTYSAVGQVINYSYLVTNTGNVTLIGPVIVTDDKVAVSCPSGQLVPGASLTCTASHTITQADLDSGSITNTARAFTNGIESNEDRVVVVAVWSPALTIVKTATPTTYSAVRQIINYSYLVTNSGNVTLSGPFTVSDDKTTDESCPATPTGLPPGASITCTASYTITQADLDAGSVTNIASATSGTVTSPTDSETVTAVQNAALTILKTATPTTYSAVRQIINYSYLVTNSGNVTLNGPFTVTDDKATVTCPVGGLAPGASITCTASYTITQADLDAGSVTNTARASANGTNSNQDSETVTAVQTRALLLDKTASATTYSTLGQVINYSYVVTNTGNVTLSGPFTVNDDKVTVSCPAGDLAPGAFITCNASYTITQDDLDAGSVTNVASATNGSVTSPTDTVTVTAVRIPALAIVKTATPTTYDSIDDVINYSYVVRNTGNVTLSGPFTVSDDKVIVSCPTGDLAPGASITCTASYTITQADLDAGSVTNVASATNGTVTSPTDSETVTAVQNAALTILKTATPTTYSAVGQVINYSYLVTNSGNVTLSGPFTVSDDKTTDEDCPNTVSLAPGASVTCTASYTITQADLDAGSVTNIASATNGTVTSPTDSETVTAVQNAALTILKTASATTYSTLGQVINYSYVVTNSGNVTLSGPFTVNDDKTTDESCPATPTGLPAGASITCTASYTITQADLDAGSVTNIASATSGTVTSPTDSETVTAVQTRALLLDKTASATTYSTLGQVINYSYVVTNTGNVTLSGPFTVNDDKVTVSCPAGDLAPGAFITCNASYTITQDDLDAGSVTNVASATNGSVTSPTDSETVTAVQNAALTILKTATPTTYSAVRQIINYSYLVTNSGNVTLSGPFTVSDDKTTDEDCPNTVSLAPGASVTCTASYTITQADLDAGSVTNIASVTNGTVTSPTDSETVTALRKPSHSTVKTETSTGPYKVGDTITYNILVTNTGNVTLTGVTVTDNNGVLGTCTPAQPSSLAPGASMTCPASHVVTQADVNSGSYVNTATGDSDQTTPNTSTVTVNFAPTIPPITPTTPPTNPNPPRPSVSFTGFIPVTGGETHTIAAGIAHTCAIKPEGGVKCWGNNDFGQLGDGTNISSNVPVDVVGLTGSTTIVAGGNHTCVLSGGSVWCWGQNSQGQIGDGTKTDRNTPVKVLSGVTDITAGLDYTCAVMIYGKVMCWGNNDQGQLADGTRTNRSTPTLAVLISGVSNVDAGRNSSCGLMGNNLLRCLSQGSVQDIGGFNDAIVDVTANRFISLVMVLAQNGVPHLFQAGRIRTVSGVTDATYVDGGLGHACALLKNGMVKCWGSNNYGQLGNKSQTNSPEPQLVQNISSAWQLAVGKYHACVLISSSVPGTNDIQCWGLNKDGQLGDGTNNNSLIPVFVK
jgi:uncharacterized repeat protein (TIGR01451 family)